MGCVLEVQETADGFIFDVKQSRSWLETLFGGGILGVACYFFLPSALHTSKSSTISCSICVAILAGLWQNRSRHVTTTVTKFEVHISGSFGGGYEPQRHIPLANIEYLEYRKAQSGGGEAPSRPKGLYAVLGYNGSCLVPYIDATQSSEISDALYMTFSHVIGSNVSFGDGRPNGDLISLNLNRP